MNMYMRAHGWRWKTLQDAKSILTSNTLGRSAKEISEHLRPGITGRERPPMGHVGGLPRRFSTELAG